MSYLKKLFQRNFDNPSTSPTSVILATFVATVLITSVYALITFNRLDQIERLSLSCDYYVETTLYWRDSPMGYTRTRDLPYRNFEYSYDQAVGEYNTLLSGEEAQFSLLDSFEVRLHSDCPYGHSVIWSNKFVASESED